MALDNRDRVGTDRAEAMPCIGLAGKGVHRQSGRAIRSGSRTRVAAAPDAAAAPAARRGTRARCSGIAVRPGQTTTPEKKRFIFAHRDQVSTQRHLRTAPFDAHAPTHDTLAVWPRSRQRWHGSLLRRYRSLQSCHAARARPHAVVPQLRISTGHAQPHMRRHERRTRSWWPGRWQAKHRLSGQ